MLQRGDAVPHFTVRRLDGSESRYRDLWQRRNLLLVVLPDPSSGDAWAGPVRTIDRRREEFDRCDAECIVTRDAVPGAPRPGVIVADRWGEIAHVVAPQPGEPPDVDDLLEWVRFVQHRCPECEGESR